MASANVAGCLLLLLAIAATTTFAVDALPRLDAPNASPGCPSGRTAVSTRYGRPQGKRIDGVVQYLGVPFAAPPVGVLRLAPPVDPLPWRGVRNATAIGPVCPQSGSAYPVSEDCLYVTFTCRPGRGPTRTSTSSSTMAAALSGAVKRPTARAWSSAPASSLSTRSIAWASSAD
ncbi:carboxylesterase [Pandoravirus inopinatum]|uniref:Carboxylesterase n=1 Tax=Pandoravirus inopinatum TaxID=1605721 RepID=A0A0B5J927_9VIRU|nr:carboxylesterase [Pandoravirus inopinatum]AJF97316.1 carboxylesterase [Pandoravirus inopinatum]